MQSRASCLSRTITWHRTGKLKFSAFHVVTFTFIGTAKGCNAPVPMGPHPH